MYEDGLSWMARKIEYLSKVRRFKNKNVYIFGVSLDSRYMIKQFKKNNISVHGMIDNDVLKQGSYCSGNRVYGLDEIENPEEDSNLYVTCSRYWREMKEQLLSLGVKSKNILIFYHDNRNLFKHIVEGYKGYKLYKKITLDKGNVPMYLCPYTGTGDIYLIGCFWEQYCKKEHITNYVFVVLGETCRKVAQLFAIRNIVVLSSDLEVSYLISLSMLCPRTYHIKVLNDSWPQIHTNSIEKLRGYKNLYFTDMFKKYVFGLDSEAKPRHPVFKDATDTIDEILKKKNLSRGNTCVISPYSYTLGEIPDKVWEELVRGLRKKGFCVCTNSGGEDEPAIEGTVSVFFHLDISVPFIDACGYFIGVRSGFCDVISSSTAKKIILYDKRNRFHMSSAFDYFSLRGMGLCEDAVELEYDRDMEALVTQVLESV